MYHIKISRYYYLAIVVLKAFSLIALLGCFESSGLLVTSLAMNVCDEITCRQWRSYTGALAPPSASVAPPSIF